MYLFIYLNISKPCEYRQTHKFLSTKMTIYGKPTTDIFSGEQLKALSLRSGTKQGCPLSPLLFNVILGVVGTVIGQEKKKASTLGMK